jgi:hypothetical protein
VSSISTRSDTAANDIREAIGRAGDSPRRWNRQTWANGTQRRIDVSEPHQRLAEHAGTQ